MKVLKQWKKLPTEVVNAPFLATFKIRLDGPLSKLIQCKMSLVIAGGRTR